MNKTRFFNYLGIESVERRGEYVHATIYLPIFALMVAVDTGLTIGFAWWLFKQ